MVGVIISSFEWSLETFVAGAARNLNLDLRLHLLFFQLLPLYRGYSDRVSAESEEGWHVDLLRP